MPKHGQKRYRFVLVIELVNETITIEDWKEVNFGKERIFNTGACQVDTYMGIIANLSVVTDQGIHRFSRVTMFKVALKILD